MLIGLSFFDICRQKEVKKAAAKPRRAKGNNNATYCPPKKYPKSIIGYEPLCFYPHLIKNDLLPLSLCNADSDKSNICASMSAFKKLSSWEIS